jgi:hypothetical protein
MSDEDFCLEHGRDFMRSNRGPIPYCAKCEHDTLKRGERFTVGNQPCQHFLRGDADIAALGPGNRRNLHECPKCSGNRAWCDYCNTDHHDGGWETCKPGAYADPPDDD